MNLILKILVTVALAIALASCKSKVDADTKRSAALIKEPVPDSAPVAQPTVKVLEVTSSNQNATYTVGDVISIQVTFSDLIGVTGQPVLQLSLDNGDIDIPYKKLMESSLFFEFVVGIDQSTKDLDYASANALVGEITSGEHQVDLSLPEPGSSGSLGSTKDIVIAIAPGEQNFPPEFAGLQGFTLPTSTSALLMWEMASDDDTSPEEMIYEVCVSDKKNACTSNFKVSHTSKAGVQSIYLTNLPASDTRYFSVRAKDKRGAVSKSALSKGSTPIIPDLAQFSAGANHACYKENDGDVYCWGTNASGEVGTGDTKPILTPTKIPAFQNAAYIDAGRGKTCIVKSDNTVWCLGTNEFGELGNGIASKFETSLVQVTGIANASKVSARGDGFVCALLSDQTVKCWGKGTLNQLGDGGGVSSLTPVTVFGLANVTQMESGRGGHSCALKADQSVWCWGNNSSGQLGDGTTNATLVPVQANLGVTATKLTAGYVHSCAVLTDNTSKCWGSNGVGKLGNGTTTDAPTPVVVTGVTNATDIVSGVHHSCALLSGGTVKCWGQGTWNGQIGTGDFKNTFTPVDIPLTGVEEIYRGEYFTMAILNSGEVAYWGGSGEMSGRGQTTSVQVPTHIPQHDDALMISFGISHGCHLGSDKKVQCWGRNDTGHLGNGAVYPDAPTIFLPAPVVGSLEGEKIWTGYGTTWILMADGSVNTFGRNEYGGAGNGAAGDLFSPTSVIGVTNPIDISGGLRHGCFVQSDKTVDCVGYGPNGQLGNGASVNSTSLVDVTGLTDVESIVSGFHHTCALKSDKTVWCWGHNLYGQLGDGTTSNRNVPVQVSLTNIKQLVANGNGVCALKQEGEVYCWGINDQGQMADGTKNNDLSPKKIQGLSGIKAISGGINHRCALHNNGEVSCWGRTHQGEAGIYSEDGEVTLPIKIGISGAEALEGGWVNTCARFKNKTYKCWGKGVMGNGLKDGISPPLSIPTR
jgi:alpha-tubulin suppressor-like RCC1 family protein